MCNKDNIDIVIMYVYVWYGRGVYWVVLICYRKGIVLDWVVLIVIICSMQNSVLIIVIKQYSIEFVIMYGYCIIGYMYVVCSYIDIKQFVIYVFSDWIILLYGILK